MHGHGYYAMADGRTYEGELSHGHVDGFGLMRWSYGKRFCSVLCCFVLFFSLLFIYLFIYFSSRCTFFAYIFLYTSWGVGWRHVEWCTVCKRKLNPMDCPPCLLNVYYFTFSSETVRVRARFCSEYFNIVILWSDQCLELYLFCSRRGSVLFCSIRSMFRIRD